MDAEVRAQLVEVAAEAIRPFANAGFANEWAALVAEAVIDALLIEEIDPYEIEIGSESLPDDLRVFRFGVLSLPPQPQAAPTC